MLLYYEDCIILLHCQFIKNISDNSFLTQPGSVITTQGVRAGRGGWWQLLTQQGDKQLNFEWCQQKLLAGKQKENSKIFNEDFYLPLYLPLRSTPSTRATPPPLSTAQQNQREIATCNLAGSVAMDSAGDDFSIMMECTPEIGHCHSLCVLYGGPS